MDLLYFVLAAYGLTQILVYGSIFDKIRPTEGWLGKLLSCPMCTGFWVGVLLFGINGCTELFTYEYNLTNLLILGWLSSGTSYIFNVVFCDGGIQIGEGNGQLDK
jgi:hypothetical protein